MNRSNLLTEENPHLVSGEFEYRRDASAVVERLLTVTGLRRAQVELLEPGTHQVARKVEPKSRAIGRTLVRTHVLLGILGLVVGLVAATALVMGGPEMTRSSPLMTFIFVPTLTMFMGLLMAGLVALRPDHGPVIKATRDAVNEGLWTVVARCADQRQADHADRVLSATARATTRSL